MLTEVRYLVDTSAIVRLPNEQVAELLVPLIEAGVVATCAVIDLELFSLLRDRADRREIQASRSAAFRWLPTTDDDLRRALEIHTLLAEQGDHEIAWTALVIAAVAERHQVSVLHHHATFAHVTNVTGQDTRWVVPQGELP